jgi:hypothetical protein
MSTDPKTLIEPKIKLFASSLDIENLLLNMYQSVYYSPFELYIIYANITTNDDNTLRARRSLYTYIVHRLKGKWILDVLI